MVADIHWLPQYVSFVGKEEPCFLEARNWPSKGTAEIVEIEIGCRISAGKLSGNEVPNALLVLNLQGGQRGVLVVVKD